MTAPIITEPGKHGWTVGFGDDPLWIAPDGTQFKRCTNGERTDVILRTKVADVHLRDYRTSRTAVRARRTARQNRRRQQER